MLRNVQSYVEIVFYNFSNMNLFKNFLLLLNFAIIDGQSNYLQLVHT